MQRARVAYDAEITPEGIIALDIFAYALVLAGCGAFAGVVAGLLGVGGGIIVVPVLYTLLPVVGVGDELRMHVAVATSLAIIIPTSISSMWSHHKRGGVDWSLFRRLNFGVAIGVVIGVYLGGRASGELLTAVFAAIAMIVAVHMAFLARITVAEKLPGQPGLSLVGAMIGFFSVLMGIGGGTLSVPIFKLCGTPIRRAVGTGAAIGLVVALPGAIGYAWSGWEMPGLPPYSAGYVSLIGLAIIAPLSMLCAPLGARIAHTIAPVWLSRTFALFLAATSIRMLLNV